MLAIEFEFDPHFKKIEETKSGKQSSNVNGK